MPRDLKHRTPLNPRPRPAKSRRVWLIGLGMSAIITGIAVSFKEIRHTLTKPFGAQATPAPSLSPRFSYFRALEDRERPIDEAEIAEEARRIRNGMAPQGGTFTLLVGTYKTPEEADAIRQRLKSFETLKPRAERVQLEFSVWYRVLLGPYTQMQDAIKVRQFLRAQGLDGTVTTPHTP